ncbi:MAG: glutaminyl-peptide cyclotransferase [Bacteroidales bacterium]
MIDFTNVKIAVDFDGTIVDHEYPEIGKEKLFAFQTLKELEKMGALLILWTFRAGKELDEAVDYCRRNGIEFYAVNKNYPEEIYDETISRKIDADIFIDDKNAGGFPGWSGIWQMLVPYELHEQAVEKRMASLRKNIFQRIIEKFKQPGGKGGNSVMMFLMLLAALTISCSGRTGKTPVQGSRPSAMARPVQQAMLFRMSAPEENARYLSGDEVRIRITPLDNGLNPDSVVLSCDGIQVTVLRSEPWEYTVPSSFTGMTGRRSLKAVGYRDDSIQTITRFIEVFSDIVPRIYGYKVLHTYPHDTEAFTQGLFYNSGFLYEGTGQEAGSSLREVELETGRIIRQLNLESSLFGEGITLYRDRIYQVTWQNKVGFVYDRATFRLINKVYYATQGWGLTTVKDQIVMSDGSNILYFFEPELFTVVSRLEVYDNEKKVDQLNELEYINGEIWANVWMTDMIVRIDPSTGKVNSWVNLSTLFPEQKRRETGADVLNGIAYDEEGGRIFVTGKRWPKLYEIRVIE